MPLFDFVCDSCNHSYEDLVSGKARSTCPECGSKKVTKQLPLFAAGPSSSDPGYCDKGPANCGMTNGMG